MKAQTKKKHFTSSCHHAQIQEFSSGGGGGGGPGPTARKQPGQRFYFSFQLVLQFTEGVQWFYYREYCTFARIQRGSNIFQGRGGVQLVPGGNAYSL